MPTAVSDDDGRELALRALAILRAADDADEVDELLADAFENASDAALGFAYLAGFLAQVHASTTGRSVPATLDAIDRWITRRP